MVFANFREKFQLSSRELKVRIQIFGIRPSVDIRDQSRHNVKTTAQHCNAVCKCTHRSQLACDVTSELVMDQSVIVYAIRFLSQHYNPRALVAQVP